jgi:hypothetical protein
MKQQYNMQLNTIKEEQSKNKKIRKTVLIS